jgi:hypothetical protein
MRHGYDKRAVPPGARSASGMLPQHRLVPNEVELRLRDTLAKFYE